MGEIVKTIPSRLNRIVGTSW